MAGQLKEDNMNSKRRLKISKLIFELELLRDNYNVYTEKLVDKQNNEYYLSFVIKEDVCTR